MFLFQDELDAEINIIGSLLPTEIIAGFNAIRLQLQLDMFNSCKVEE